MQPSALSRALHPALEDRVVRLLVLTEDPAWFDQPEAVHQARVASRRLRAVLEWVDPEDVRGFRRQLRRARRLTRLLGTLRERDVQAAKATSLAPEATWEGGPALLEHLLERLERRCRRSRERLGRELPSLKLPRLRRLLKPLPGAPDPDGAEALDTFREPLLQRIRDLLDRRESATRTEDPEALHAFRIQVKKLRYAMELLGPLGAPEPVEELARLKQVQGALGEHHDWSMLEADLWRRHARLTERRRPALAAGTLELLGIVVERRRQAFEAVREASAALDSGTLEAWLLPAGAGGGPP